MLQRLYSPFYQLCTSKVWQPNETSWHWEVGKRQAAIKRGPKVLGGLAGLDIWMGVLLARLLLLRLLVGCARHQHLPTTQAVRFLD